MCNQVLQCSAVFLLACHASDFLFDMQAKDNGRRAAAEEVTEVRGWLQLGGPGYLNCSSSLQNDEYERVEP
jgi:hypothetical protein